MINNIIKIFDKTKSLGIEIKQAWLRENILVTETIPKMIFKLDNVDSQLASLQLILSEAKIESKELEIIDLRFDKPVIKFAPEKK